MKIICLSQGLCKFAPPRFGVITALEAVVFVCVLSQQCQISLSLLLCSSFYMLPFWEDDSSNFDFHEDIDSRWHIKIKHITYIYLGIYIYIRSTQCTEHCDIYMCVYTYGTWFDEGGNCLLFNVSVLSTITNSYSYQWPIAINDLIVVASGTKSWKWLVDIRMTILKSFSKTFSPENERYISGSIF